MFLEGRAATKPSCAHFSHHVPPFMNQFHIIFLKTKISHIFIQVRWIPWVRTNSWILIFLVLSTDFLNFFINVRYSWTYQRGLVLDTFQRIVFTSYLLSCVNIISTLIHFILAFKKLRSIYIHGSHSFSSESTLFRWLRSFSFTTFYFFQINGHLWIFFYWIVS